MLSKIPRKMTTPVREFFDIPTGTEGYVFLNTNRAPSANGMRTTRVACERPAT